MLRADLSNSNLELPPTCTKHENEGILYMCFDPDCHHRILCKICALSEHNSGHQKHIFKIDEYLQTLATQSPEDAFVASHALQNLISKQADLIDQVRSNQEKCERELLDHFDLLKYEMSQALDLGYAKQVKVIREYYESQIFKISKGFQHAKHLLSIQSFILEGTIPTSVDETELSEFSSTLALMYNQSSLLCNSLQKEFEKLNAFIRKEPENPIFYDEFKALDMKKKALLSFLADTYEIKEQLGRKASAELSKQNQDSSKVELDRLIYCLAVINADLIATAGAEMTIKLWDLKKGDCLKELTGHQDTIWDLQAGFDGKYLFSASEDKSIKVWKTTDEKCKKTLTAHKSPVLSLCVLSDRKLMASGSKDGVLLLWDLPDKKVKQELVAHSKAIRGIKFLRKDQIVSGSDDGSYKIWDINTGNLIKTTRASQGNIMSIRVFGKGQRILTGDSVGDLKIWDTEHGTLVTKISAHKKGVLTTAVSQDGELLASGGGDKAFKIWDIGTVCLLKQVEENDSSIHCLEFLDQSSVLYCDLNPKRYKFSKW